MKSRIIIEKNNSNDRVHTTKTLELDSSNVKEASKMQFIKMNLTPGLFIKIIDSSGKENRIAMQSKDSLLEIIDFVKEVADNMK